jgi:hypothetical protein
MDVQGQTLDTPELLSYAARLLAEAEELRAKTEASLANAVYDPKTIRNATADSVDSTPERHPPDLSTLPVGTKKPRISQQPTPDKT